MSIGKKLFIIFSIIFFGLTGQVGVGLCDNEESSQKDYSHLLEYINSKKPSVHRPNGFIEGEIIKPDLVAKIPVFESEPECGNGIVEKNEECDHGLNNGDEDDTCDEYCDWDYSKVDGECVFDFIFSGVCVENIFTITEEESLECQEKAMEKCKLDKETVDDEEATPTPDVEEATPEATDDSNVPSVDPIGSSDNNTSAPGDGNAGTGDVFNGPEESTGGCTLISSAGASGGLGFFVGLLFVLVPLTIRRSK